MTLQKKQLIAARLRLLLERSQGRLTPDVVVDDARDPTSPLHDQFEWNDDEAARLYRLDQARTLIRSVKVEVLVDKRSVSVPAYVHDPSDQAKRGLAARRGAGWAVYVVTPEGRRVPHWEAETRKRAREEMRSLRAQGIPKGVRISLEKKRRP